MSLRVRHLNGDSTFLLLFSAEPHPVSSGSPPANDEYSVLIDPWITGSSIVNGKWFAVTDRVEPSAISHLSELDEPDVVICSQNKPDHTHKETLLQLRPEGKTVIAAEPGAAKAIKSWNYFDPNRVHSLRKYDPKAKFGNSLRLYIAPLSPEGLPGELVISFIPAKNYVTGLHNAIGITYQAPTRTKTVASVTTVDLPKPKYFHIPLSPASATGAFSPQLFPPALADEIATIESQENMFLEKPKSHRPSGHRPQLSRSSNTASSDLLSFQLQPHIRASMEEFQPPEFRLDPAPRTKGREERTHDSSFNGNLPTPPDSPDSNTQRLTISSPLSSGFTPKSSISSLSGASTPHSHGRPLSASNKPPTIHPGRPKAVSVLYTPHGIAVSDLKPYVQNHLVQLPGALPLTLLLHSFEYATNPWYFGGNIMTGASGGMAIAKSLMARCWISAHDEIKEKRGVAVKLLKTEQMSAEDIRRQLARDDEGRAHGWICDVRTLASGKEMSISGSERDLLVGSTCDGAEQGRGNEASLPPPVSLLPSGSVCGIGE